MTLATVARVLQVAAMLLAWPVARRRPSYRPVAVFLAAMTLAGWARLPLAAYLATLPRPRPGWSFLAFLASDGLFLAWPAAVAALALVVLARVRPWPVLVVWALAVVGLAVASPPLRGEALMRWGYGGATALAVLVGAVACAVWFGRREAPRVEHVATFLAVTMTGATLAGPYLGGVVASWDLARGIFATLYALLAVIEGGNLWIRSSPSPSPSPSPPPGHLLH